MYMQIQIRNIDELPQAAQQFVDAMGAHRIFAFYADMGAGSFEIKERAARVGRNPRTKEEIAIPASRVAAFKVGKALKDAVAK